MKAIVQFWRNIRRHCHKYYDISVTFKNLPTLFIDVYIFFNSKFNLFLANKFHVDQRQTVVKCQITSISQYTR